jgi:enamine deaminase RidA (YjgF/YER057c/UK114 family)
MAEPRAGGRRRFRAGTEWEAASGYSLAIRARDLVFVSGETGIGDDGQLVGPGDAYLQAKQALANIGSYLAGLGCDLEDIVQTRMYLVRREDWELVAKAHREMVGEAAPAATMVVVKELLDPAWLVEIDAIAVAQVKD